MHTVHLPQHTTLFTVLRKPTIFVKALCLLLLVGFLGIEGVKGQAASSTWALTSNSSVSNTGNVTGGAQSGGSGIGTMSYTANGVSSNSWGTTGLDANDYYQFSISPSSGYDLTVTSISTTNNLSSQTATGQIQYSYSSSFTSPVSVGATFALSSSAATTTRSSLSISVTNGQTLYVRVFIYKGTGDGITSSQTVRCKDFNISGSVALSSGPPTLTTPTSSSISNTSATIGATITANGGASISARGTAYKTVTGVTATDNQLAEGGTSVAAFSHSRTGLSPQTQYFYVGYATNSNGTAISSEGSFRTLSNPPTAQPSSFSTTSGSSSLTANWTTASFPGSGATNTGYALIYAASPSTPTLSSANGATPAAGVGTLVNITSGATLTSTISGLANGTTYNFLLVPYTWDGANATTYNYLTTSALTTTGTPAAVTYTWVGGTSGSWVTPSNWSPGTSAAGPSTGDNVVFNTGSTITIGATVPTVTLGNITISNTGTNVTLSVPSNTSRTLTLSNSGTALSIASGTTLNLIGNGTGSLTLNYSGSGNTASIAGTLNLQIGASTGVGNYNATNSTTTVTGVMTVNNTTSAITSTSSNLIFASGSEFTHNNDGGAIPTANWNSNSTLRVTGITAAVEFSGNSVSQTFGNVIWACTSQSSAFVFVSVTTTPSTAAVAGNFTVTGTGSTGSLQLPGADKTTFTIGGAYLQSGGTVYVSNGSTTNRTLTVAGSFTLNQNTTTSIFNISNTGSSGTHTLNVGGNFTFSAGTISRLAVTANVNFNGTSQQVISKTGGTVSGIVNFIALNGSIISFDATSVLDGTNATFNANSGSTIITANTGGFASTGATGSVQVGGTRTYSTGANYTYNNSASQAQVTGTGLPTSGITGTVTINNPTGVTLSQALGFSGAGALALTSGKLTTNGFALTLTNSTTGSTSSYIVTDATGTVTMSAVTTAKTLPIGTASSYAPLRITAGSSTNYTAYVSASVPVAVFDATKTVGLAWSINGTNAPSSVIFQWNSGNQGASFTAGGTIDMGRTGSTPTTYTITAIGSAAGTDPNTITASSGFVSGSNWYVLGNTNAVRLDAPTLATTVAANSITTTAASSGGQTIAGNALSAKGVVWNTSTAPTVALSTKTNEGTSTANFTSSLSSLSPETQYFVRAYATNDAGTGYAPEVNFRTLSNPATAQASNFAGNATSTTDIDLTWDAATFPVSGATATGYVLLRATSPNTPSLASANGTAPSAGTNTTLVTSLAGSSVSYTNSGLAHTTTYNYLLVPFTWDGTNAATYNYLTSAAPTVSVTTQSPALPTITTSGTLSAVSTVYGTASTTPTSFTVSGASLTNDIVITPPSGFEISTTIGSGYSGTSLTLTQSGGVVGTTTIYVRLAANTPFGTYSGNITLTSDDASTPASTTVATASSNVTAASLTITGITGDNRDYDGTLAATVTGTPVYNGLKNGDNLSVTGTPSYAFATAAVGTGKTITVTGYTAPNSNYSVSQPTDLTANITPRTLSITAATIASKTYNVSATSGTVTPGTLSGFAGTETVTVATAVGTYADANVGTGKTATIVYTLANGTNGGLATNYSLANTTATGDITIAGQTITFGTLANKLSTDAPFALTATSNSGLAVTYTSSNPAVATVSGSTVTIVGVGTTTITASQAGNSNYTAATDVARTLTVTLAPVTVYYEDFGSNSTVALPYSSGTNATNSVVLATGLTSPSWTQSLTSQGFAGNTGGAMTATVSSTYTVTATIPVTTGYQFTPSSISFDSRITGTGPTTLNISISGTGGSTSITQYSLDRTNNYVTVPAQSFANTSLNLTGTITLTFSYSGSGGGNTRLDNVYLAGNMSCITPSQPSAITGNTTVCESTSQTYSVTNTTGVGYTWLFPSGWSSTGTTNSVSATPSSTSGTITVTPYNSASGCASTTGTARTLAVTANAKPTTSNLSAAGTTTVTGNGAVVTVSSSSLTDGSYIVTYSVSGTNTVSSTTSSMTFAGGTGTFTTSDLASAGSANIVNITAIAFNGGTGCSSTVSTSTASFSTVTPTATVSNTSFAQFTTQSLSRNTTNSPVTRFRVDVTNASVTLSSLSFGTPNNSLTNNYIGGTDINNFKLWYGTTTTFASATQIGTTQTAVNNNPSAGETVSFSSLATSLPVGTYYFWVSADILSSSTSGRTITVNAPSLTLSTGSLSGSTTATSTQTIIAGSATNYYLQNSTVGTAASWNTLANGSGSALSSILASDVNLIIDGISNAAVTTDLVLGNGSKLIVGQNSAAQLTISNNASVTGTIDVGANGTLVINNGINPTLGTVNAASTIVYNLAGNQTSTAVASYGNVTLGGSGTKTLANSVSLSGTLTVPSGITLDASNTVLSGTGSIDVQAGATLIVGHASGINGFNTTSGTSTFSTGANYTFNGSSSQALGSALPSTVNNLTISNGNPALGLNGSTTVNGALALSGGTKLSIGSSTLTLNGTFSGNASNSIIGSATSNLTIGGSGAFGTLYFDQTSNTTKTLNNLVINRTTSGTVSLGNGLRLVGELTPTAGVLTTGGNLRLLSSAIGTSAAIGVGSNSGGYISGTVDIERYSQAQRGYRTFAHPYTSAQSVGQLTDNFQVTGLTSGALGTYGVGGSTLPSAFYYDGTKPAGNAFVLGRITKSDSLAWGVGKGLYVFVRGNGSEGTGGTYSAGISPVTLDVTNANINQGDVTVSLTPYTEGADNFTLVGNPYPCPINLSNVTNISSFGTIYLQNPTYSAGSTTSLRGGFESTSDKNIVIPSMGCFYIQSTAITPSSITFHESDKVAGGSSSYAVFGTGAPKPTLGLEISTSVGFMDRTKIAFDANASSTATDFYDAGKLGNNLVTFYSLSSERKALGIDYRKTNTTEIIPLGIQTTVATNYTIKLSELSNLPNTQVVLKDKLLNKETVLSQVGDSYSFDITADATTKGENRFEIGLLGTTVLPVQIVDITAQLQSNKAIAVNWISTTEVNLASYKVQRSKDGSNFTTVGTVAAKGASAYNYTDDLSTAGVLPATIYYRLEALDKDGSKTYSKVVSCQLPVAVKSISIYPNPVQTTLFAQVTVTKAGAGQLKVVDAQGKVVATQKTQLAVGTTSISIPAAQLSAGSYVLEIETADGKQTQRFVKE